MKKLAAILAVLLAVLLAGCNGSNTAPPVSVPSTGSVAEHNATGSAIALVTTEERLDSTCGQWVWNTLSRFAGESNHNLATYKTEADTAEAAVSALELAIKGGARLVVAMDDIVSAAVAGNASLYPDTYFILIDEEAGHIPGPNTVSIRFSAVQAGWLAGYVAMREARDTLGLVTLPDDSSQQYSLGFVLGADTAATEVGLPAGSVSLMQLVLDGDEEAGASSGTPPEDPTEQISSLYTYEADIVFASSAKVQQTLVDAARTARKWMMGIGLQPDKTAYGVLAGILCDPRPVLQQLLDEWKTGSFAGGRVAVGGAGDGSVRLELAPEHLEQVGVSILNRMPNRFADGTLAAQLETLVAQDANGAWPAAEQLELTCVRVRPPGPDEPPATSTAAASSQPVDDPSAPADNGSDGPASGT